MKSSIAERKAHWEEMYRTKLPDEMGWYETYPAMSLKLVLLAGIDKNAHIIDIGGGISFFSDKLLDKGFKHITVLDISGTAIEKAKARFGKQAANIIWIEAHITEFEPSRTYDLWHDRAVFHFLTDPADRKKYLEVMKRALNPTGRVIMATFGLNAPPKCSGVDVARYSPELLSREIDGDFELMHAFDEIHITPSGKEQPFIYCLFAKRS